MRPTRLLATASAALLAVIAAAAPANAAWLTSSDPNESVNATLRVDDSPKVSRDGWRVTWKIRLKCPQNQRITGRLLLAERDPASIPQLAGEDQGITAVLDLGGPSAPRCTGQMETLKFVLNVLDTPVFDPATGEQVVLHEPIHPTPTNRTTAAVTLSSVRSVEDGGFFVQYCAAPNCASESGPRVRFR